MAKLKLVSCWWSSGGPFGVGRCSRDPPLVVLFIDSKKITSLYFPLIGRLTETQGRGPDGGLHWASGLSEGWAGPLRARGTQHCCTLGFSHLIALNSSLRGRALNHLPPVMALQLHAKGLSSDFLPWNMTVSSVMAELIIRNGLPAGSWMVIMIGTFAALRPRSVDVCWGGKNEKPWNMKKKIFFFFGTSESNAD